MVRKLAILTKTLGHSQLNYYVTQNLNVLLKNFDDVYATLFFEMVDIIPYAHNFPIMHIAEAFEWGGPIIATSLSTLDKMLTFPYSKEKYFYVWDLEWIRLQNKQYKPLCNLYRNPNVQLIARSEEHADIIDECWNVRPKLIMGDFSWKKLIEIL